MIKYASYAAMVLVLVYLAIAAYGNYRTWDSAFKNIYQAFSEIDNMRQVDLADSVTCDSLYAIVMSDTAEHKPTDEATKKAIDDLIARLTQRQYAIKQLETKLDSLHKYVRAHEPFWHHVYASLTK